MYSAWEESLDGLELICTSKHGIVHYVIFRGELGVSIVKPTTPSLALCKYTAYICIFCLTLCTAGSTTPYLNIYRSNHRHLGLFQTGWSSLSRVARGTTRDPSIGTCCVGLTSVPPSLKGPQRTVVVRTLLNSGVSLHQDGSNPYLGAESRLRTNHKTGH